MSNGDNQTFWQSMLKEAVSPAFILAMTGLVTALGLHCDTKQVTQQHTQEIKQNKEAIGEVKETATVAAKEADIAKDKAVTIEKKVEKIEERKTDK